MARHVTQVTSPWNDQPMELDSAAAGTSADTAMAFVADEVAWDSDELPRIMTAAVMLYAEGKGTFGECLETAIIWERG